MAAIDQPFKSVHTQTSRRYAAIRWDPYDSLGFKVLEKQPGKRSTSTSLWNSSPRRTAAYKLLKVTRWLLKDEDMLFDPLHRSHMETLEAPHIIDDICGLVEPDTSQDQARDVINKIRSFSANRILGLYLTKKDVQGLREIDKALAKIDVSTDDLKLTKKCDLEKYFDNENIKFSLHRWQKNVLEFAVEPLVEGKKIEEHVFAGLARDLFSIVLKALEGEYFVQGDDYNLKKRHGIIVKDIAVTSEPDLYIMGAREKDRTMSSIAVVEVKGRDLDGNIMHSTCTSEAQTSANEHNHNTKKKVKKGNVERKMKASSHTGDSRCIKKRDADEDSSDESDISDGSDTADETEDARDIPDFDDLEERRIDSPPNDNLRSLMPEERMVLRDYLPQLLGQLVCTFHLNTWGGGKQYHGTYRLGVAVTGFLVQFVGMIIEHEDDEFGHKEEEVTLVRIPELLHHNEKLRTVLFLTRSLDLLVRKDRQVVMRILACAAILNCRK